MKKLIREPLLYAFIFLTLFLWAWTQHNVHTQPVPKQEQNTRLIQALEQHNRALEQQTRAIKENTQAVREMAQAMRSQNRPF